MQWIREYLFCVTAAAILCGIIRSLIKSKGTASSIVKLLSGLFLLITAISPWVQFDGLTFPDTVDSLVSDGELSVQEGERIASDAMALMIKENTEAYILDKAAYLEMSITVDVTVSEDAIPVPIAVSLSGMASPYAMRTLSHYIATDLGIPEEAQIWS